MTSSSESVSSIALSAHLAEQSTAGRSGGSSVCRGSILSSLNVELVGLRSVGRRRRAESTGRQEQGPDGVGGVGWIGRGVFVQVSRGSQNVVTFLVRLGESLLSLQETDVNGLDRRVVLAGVVDQVRVPQGSLGVEQVVGSSGKGDPFTVGHQLGHVDAQGSPGLLNAGGHSRLPFVKGLPGGLNGPNDAFLEVGRVLLHDDDGLLQGVLLVDLLLQLPVDSQVNSEGVFLAGDAHRGVSNGTDSPGQIGNGLGGEFSLLGNRSGELSSVVLDVLQVGLDLRSKLLQVLNDRGIDGSREVGV